MNGITVKEGYVLMAYVHTMDLDVAIIYRDAAQDFVVCWGYDPKDGTWCQGHYVGSNYQDALDKLKLYL